MKTLAKSLHNIAAVAMVTFGALASSSAFAGAIFTVNPTVINGSGSVFTANQLSGSSSARLVREGVSNVYDGKGYITYSTFTNGGTTVLGGVSGLNNTYQLYATFTQKFTCPGALTVGVECAVSAISLNLFADQNADTVLTETAVGADYGITGNGTDILLATVNVGFGTAGINSGGGAAENVLTNFVLTPFGATYFTVPDPFYQFAFSAFNNTAPGLKCDTGNGLACINPSDVSITLETGTTDFIANAVPEPASLALFGLALAGMAGVRRRMSK